MTPILHIGNKNYSSWSLRPWLALRWAGIAFEERVVLLGGPGYGRGEIPEVRAISPTGRVPALELDEGIVWDSLAIAEWAAERAPSLLPDDPFARAVCRSVVCEMHSGFAALRRELPMNIRRRSAARAYGDEVRADLTRVEQLWAATRERFGASGPFLFGARSLADAFFAPVVTRLRTYGVALSPTSAAYASAVLADAELREWEAAAEIEPATIASTDSI